MKLPKLIYVGPFDFDVHQKTEMDMLGETFSNDGRIEVKRRQSAANKRDTLLHEVLHAIVFHSGLGHKLSHDDEEHFVVTISPWILAVLRDNPALVSYLLAGKD